MQRESLQLTQAHGVFTHAEGLNHAAQDDVEATSFVLTLLAYVILCSFFWVYFDSHDPDAWAEHGAYLQSLHLPMYFCVSAVAASLNRMLLQLNCAALRISQGELHEHPSVPLPISFLFSGCLASAVFFQGLIAIVAVKHDGEAAGWWAPGTWLRLHGYNVLRSTLVLLIPLFAGLDGASVLGLVGVAATLSVAMVAVDVGGLKRLQESAAAAFS